MGNEPGPEPKADVHDGAQTDEQLAGDPPEEFDVELPPEFSSDMPPAMNAAPFAAPEPARGLLPNDGEFDSDIDRATVPELTPAALGADGEARLTDGFTAGYLPQEPQLNEKLDVWGNLQEAIAPRRKQVDRYNEISAALAEPMDDERMQKLCDEMARLQDQIEASGAWEIDRELEIAMDAMNLPEKEADVARLSGGERRRVAMRREEIDRERIAAEREDAEPDHQVDIGHRAREEVIERRYSDDYAEDEQRRGAAERNARRELRRPAGGPEGEGIGRAIEQEIERIGPQRLRIRQRPRRHLEHKQP